MTALSSPAHDPSHVVAPDGLEVPGVPLSALLDGAARRWGDRAAFVHPDRDGGPDRTLSYTELWRRACGLAHLLVERGVRPGDVVGVHLPNCLAFPVAYWGIVLAGATFSPASPVLPAAELGHQIEDAGAVAVITLDPRVPHALPTGGVDVLADLGGREADAPPEVDVDPAVAVAHIAYTGGTTGRSKGVVLTHRNVVANVLQFVCLRSGARPAPDVAGGLTVEQTGSVEEFPLRLGRAVSMAVAPWFHAMGTGGMTIALVSGSTAVVQERFDAGRYLAELERHAATTLTGAPAMYHALAAHPDVTRRDLGSVREISSGAAPMPTSLAGRLHELMPAALIVEGYGLTEATMGLTSSSAARSGHRRVGTVGLPVPGTEIQLLPVAGGSPGGDPVPRGESGEVWARGPQIMRGYHRRPEETDATLVDGWLRTGDIAVVGDDGLLAVVDRAKDMLLYKGYNVFPRELEERLLAHPAIRSAAVVGRPDDAAGELPVAVLVPADPGTGTERDGDPEPDGDTATVVARVVEAVNAEVRPYERLRHAYVVDELPVSAAGKILKRRLRDELADPVWSADHASGTRPAG